jgi:hypothetical protein
MIVINQFLLIAVLSTNRSLEETITKELIECQGAPVDIGKSNQTHRWVAQKCRDLKFGEENNSSSL